MKKIMQKGFNIHILGYKEKSKLRKSITSLTKPKMTTVLFHNSAFADATVVIVYLPTYFQIIDTDVVTDSYYIDTTRKTSGLKHGLDNEWSLSGFVHRRPPSRSLELKRLELVASDDELLKVLDTSGCTGLIIMPEWLVANVKQL